MKKTLYILIMCMLGWCQMAMAGYQFTHYDMSSGLSQNTVLAIAQDETGFMWFGTKNGLNRFDGHFFKQYFIGHDDHHLKSDYINALCLGPDKRLWIGTDAGVFIYNPSKDVFEQLTVKTNDGKQVTSNVSCMTVGGDYVYMSSHRKGVFRYDTKSKTLTNAPDLGTGLRVTSMALDGSGNLWVGLFGGDIYKMKDDFTGVHRVTNPKGQNFFTNTNISGIVIAEQGQLFVGTENSGVNIVNTNTGEITRLTPPGNQKGLFVHALLRSGNEIWAATEDGLYVYEMLTHEVSHYQYEATNPFSLSDNPLQTVFRDKEGGLWAGTYFGGVNYSSHKLSSFDSFFPRADKENTLHGRHVREIVEDNTGMIWIGTEDGGLNRFNPETGSLNYIAESATFPNIHGLCVDGDYLWVGTFSYGLRVIDTKTQKIVKNFWSDGSEGALRDNNIFSIYRSHSGRIYFGTLSGVCYMENGKFKFIDEVPNTIVYDMSEDNNGNFWVGTYGSGVYMRSAKTKKWTAFTTDNKSLVSNNVLSVVAGKNGNVWITTESGGLYEYAKGKMQYVAIPKDAPCHIAFRIVEDTTGKLWLTTNNGLVSYDPKTTESQIYTTDNGLLDNNFNYKSAMCSRRGRIYVGSLSGFSTFVPENLQQKAHAPAIVATELMINNNVVDNHTEDSPLTESITVTKRLTLSHSQNSFSLKVSALLFASDQQSQLEYMLCGFDKSWQPLSNENLIRYTNLPSGTYKLLVRVQGANTEANGQSYELEIIVRPAFYFSWWAWLLYLILIVVVAYAAWRFFTQRSMMHRRLAMEKFEHEKEQELYQSKISFFTNVAHEIRTPLTLIKAPLENILKKDINDRNMKEDLGIMDQNVNRLLDLTNQLLDFRNTERDGLRLNIERCNINAILQGVYVRFTTLMREKQIASQIFLPQEPIYAYVDKENVTKIISNLINNAVKYCESTITVELKQVNEDFQIVLKNDGNLVPKHMREQIFTPFVRGNNVASNTTGTGIGLALARTLSELHNGQLEMLDDPQLNVFALTIPISNAQTIQISNETTEKMDEAVEEEPLAEETAPTILVVEDNLQMQQYEKQKLQHHYNVLTANNGEEALAILADHDVDAIVSDAMMEPMDGFKLCRVVKENVNTSHIPFILLTALTLDSAKVEGMEAGADSYIEKPFSLDYLLSTIKNLLRARQNAKSAYAQSPFIPSDTVTISKVDEEFMKRLDEVMEKNLCDSDFGITEMAEQMFMSRTGLNRKIRGVFNLTPNNYIKVERLKKAAYLMKTKNYKVNEVCYMVGFTSPSYFTQCFFKQFGLLPKEFINTDND